MGSLLEEHANKLRSMDAQERRLAERERELREREQEVKLQRDKLDVEQREQEQRRMKAENAREDSALGRAPRSGAAEDQIHELEKELKERES